MNIRIDCYFRTHMEYKRPDGGLKNYREALARFTEFSNLRLGVYTPYAHENSNQTLNEKWCILLYCSICICMYTVLIG